MNKKQLRPDLQHIVDMIEPNTKILDIGCGKGELLDFLTHEKGVDGRGIELSQNDVTTCVKKGLPVIQGDADTDLSHYPNRCFDYVISSQMLQATRHPKTVLKEMSRIGKKVIIATPNFGHWHNRFYLLIRGKMPVTKSLTYQWYETPNIHFSTVEDFENLCHDLSLYIEDELLLNTNHNELSIIEKFISSNMFCSTAIFTLSRTKPKSS